MTKKLNTSKEEWGKQMNTFFETFKQANETERKRQKKKDAAFRKSLLAAVRGNNKDDEDDESETPSGDENSAHGGDK